jgi:hypothetical protein
VRRNQDHTSHREFVASQRRSLGWQGRRIAMVLVSATAVTVAAWPRACLHVPAKLIDPEHLGLAEEATAA